LWTVFPKLSDVAVTCLQVFYAYQLPGAVACIALGVVADAVVVHIGANAERLLKSKWLQRTVGQAELIEDAVGQAATVRGVGGES